MGSVNRATPLVLLLAAACSTGWLNSRERDLEDLERHRAQWRAQQIHAYVFEYNRLCFCPVEITRHVRIDVRGDTVFRATDVQTSTDVTHLEYTRWPTIDSLFASARRTMEKTDWKYEIEFDPTLGYVRRFSGDLPHAVDDEFVETVYSFTRIP